MKKLLFTLALVVGITTNGSAQENPNILDLDSQSMCITGKGPGQDGAINPYAGEACIAVVENMGNNRFSIRVQSKGKIVAQIPIKPNETKEVRLPKGTELYFDSDLKTKAKVEFKRIAY